MPEHQYYVDDFEADEGTILKTVRFEQQRDYSPPTHYRGSISDIPKQSNDMNDQRPIRPMKSNLEFDRAFNDDGIPSDPALTNEYYKNFNDFEIDSSPERMHTKSTLTNRSTTRNSMSQTIAPNRRVATAGVVKNPLPTSKYVTRHAAHTAAQQQQQQRQQTTTSHRLSKKPETSMAIASKTFSGNEPRYSKATQLEYEQLIALSNNRNDSNKLFRLQISRND